MTYAVSPDPSRRRPFGVGATLRNMRRTVELQLAAPLDAKPNSSGASGPVDVVLAAVLVGLVESAAAHPAPAVGIIALGIAVAILLRYLLLSLFRPRT